MPNHLISIEGISKRYLAKGGTATTVFDDLWLQVDRGEFVCIVGHSGCGKTTVLNILAGLDTPTDGVVIVDGREVVGPSPRSGGHLSRSRAAAVANRTR